MKVDIITLFPGMIEGPLNESILKRARERDILEIRLVNLRDFARDRHRTVDDSPFGGGAGMVLKPDVLMRAIDSCRTDDAATVVLLTPQGTPFRQQTACRLAAEGHLILVCGHYEGVDERIRQTAIDLELSIGDYVLTNGALAALIVVDAVCRLVPGVLGSSESAETDSFNADRTLDYPEYTRPADWNGIGVPKLLLGGHHQAIKAWRRQQAVIRTIARRPDLISSIQPDGADQ